MSKPLLLAAVVVVLFSSVASANKAGVFSVPASGCNNCHSGGMAPTVTLLFSKAEAFPGEVVTATVRVSTPNGTTGGFLLRAASGTLSNPGAGAKVNGSNATHTAPKTENMNGNAVFTVDWTVPLTASTGNIAFDAFGNSVNGNNATTGDLGATKVGSVKVCADKYFPDTDGDGFGTGAGMFACAAMAGFATAGGDCDDTSVSVAPGVVETCNGVDDNCDMQVDEGLKVTWYADDDADGFGDSANAMTTCPGMQPAGSSSNGEDCDDMNAAVKPDASETCNMVDDDCNGLVDDGVCGNPVVDAGTTGPKDAGTSGGADAGTGGEDEPGGCGCANVPGSSLVAFAVAALGVLASRRRRT